MVYSNLNGSIFYKETLALNENDKGHASPKYVLELFGETVTLTLGRLNTIYTDKNVVYYPVYLERNTTNPKNKQMQIGVYEVESGKSLQVIDDDGDVDADKLDPLLFNMVDEAFIKKIMSGSSISEEVQEEPVVKKEIKKEKEEDDEEDRVIKVKIPDSKKSEQLDQAKKELDSGIFETDPNITPPPLLDEETEEDATEIKAKFKKNARSHWIASFMKNNYFKIHEVEANGDCFFATIRDAFKQIGQITTVAKLRAIVAEEITDTFFQDRRGIYLSIAGELPMIEKEMKEIKRNLDTTYKVRMNEAKEKNDAATIAQLKKEETQEKQKYSNLQSEKNAIDKLIEETVGDLSTIDTVEKLRERVKKPSFWADTWTIGVIERRLNIKMIILSERSYKEKSFDNIMECGEIDKQIQEKGNFAPSHYVMVSFSGNHFKLITYKDKRIFKFHEIPFYVKNLIINKCLEKAAGPFYVISDFKDALETKFGRKTDDSSKKTDDDLLHSELYNPKTLFIFGMKSSKSAKPGNMSGEKIAKEDIKSFLHLQQNKDWRQKLDDVYEAQFKLDGHRWLTVEHYYQGSKFINGFPDFSMQFSLDSESEISKSPDLAIDAAGKTGMRKGVVLRPKGVVVDPTFYGERSAKTRENALVAKFSQNEDLKQMILSTRDAKLAHFIRGDEPEVDMMLMEVRKKIAGSP